MRLMYVQNLSEIE